MSNHAELRQKKKKKREREEKKKKEGNARPPLPLLCEMKWACSDAVLRATAHLFFFFSSSLSRPLLAYESFPFNTSKERGGGKKDRESGIEWL